MTYSKMIIESVFSLFSHGSFSCAVETVNNYCDFQAKLCLLFIIVHNWPVLCCKH